MDIITRQEKNLLLGSSICQEDIELKKFLSSFPKYKGIDENEIERLKSLNKRVYLLLKSEDARKAIVGNSFCEWVIEQHIGEKPFPCELCGSPISKDKYTIRDRKTKHTYKIGTSCVKKFPEDIRIKNGNDIFETKNWTKEQYERSAEFFDVYKTGKTIFNEWTKKYNDLELLMPLKFDNKFKNILKNGKKFYQDFIDNTLPKGKTINAFEYIKIDFESLYRECIQYINENKNDKYICHKNIVESINKKVILEIKKLDICRINRYSAKHITNTNFINRFEEPIKKIFADINLKLIDISNEGVNIEYSYQNKTRIVILIPLQIFANNYSETYFSDNYRITLNKILDDSMLMKTVENISNFLEIMQSLLVVKNYYINYNQNKNDEIEIKNADNEKYSLIDINSVDEYITILNLTFDDAKEFLSQRLDKLNWIDNKEKKKYNIGDISKNSTRTHGKKDEKQYNQYESEEEYYQRIKKQKKETIII